MSAVISRPPPGTRLPDVPSCELLATQLRRHTQGEVLFDAASRGRYATDASIYQIMPAGVFVPKTAQDISTAMALAREVGVPVLPRGGGTSQCGQTTGAALVIDNSKHFKSLIDLDLQAQTATVQPGMVLDHLNAALKAHGLWFPVDVSTSAQATLGGMAGNNSCGSRSIAYGNMVHNVLGASAWLSDGSLHDFGPVANLAAPTRRIADFVAALAHSHRADIETHWPKVLRRVGGYNLDIFCNQSERPYTQDGSVNLAHLLIGSEGTLAYTHSLRLQLCPLPGAKVLGIVNFAHFRDAMQAAQHIVTLGPTAVELMDRSMVALALANPAFQSTMQSALIGQPDAILLVEFCGESKDAIVSKLDDLSTLMGDWGHPGSVVHMPEDAKQKALWEVRKAGLNIMMSLKGDGKPVSFIEDCAVPLEHLADYTDALTEVFARHGTRGTWYAHASVGTLHVRPILDMRQGGATKMRAIAEEAAALVRRFKGAYSGEHGDGLCRGEWIQWQFGPRITQALTAIKQHMDPAGLFNPGKIIDTPRMDDVSLLRFPPAQAPQPYRRIPIQTALDWSAWNVQVDPVTQVSGAPGSGGDATGGLAMAVEMCNNNGHCRKFDSGTMCPSYRVTQDEQHLTRGRANTLRLALSGQLGPDAFTSEAMHETMDLCVGCKGCKRECPTGVDMAKMKTEFLHHYTQRHGHSLGERLVAHLPDYAGLASRAAGLLNGLVRLPGVAWLLERTLGLSQQRSLPRWRSDTFWQDPVLAELASADALLAHVAQGGKAAVLFVDTFNGFWETGNALAALKVLHAAGYRVHALRKDQGAHCCGRTFLANGMVGQARQRMGALVQALEPLAQAGIPIVGLEPSCLLTLRDEALAMGLGPSAHTVAAKAVLLEEFIATESKTGRFGIAFKPSAKPVLVHGHCHQKAFDTVSALMQVLARVPGTQARLIETSCCGMAGAFGYQARHFTRSMQMAELSLLPAIRAVENAWVIADGTSCRHQIRDGAQREATHLAIFLAAHLPD